LNLKEGADTPYTFVMSKTVLTREYYLRYCESTQNFDYQVWYQGKKTHNKTDIGKDLPRLHYTTSTFPFSVSTSLFLPCVILSPVLITSVWQWTVQGVGVSA